MSEKISGETILSSDGLIPAEPTPGRARDFSEMFDRIAAGLYSLASMLVGEGEDGVRLVETAITNDEVLRKDEPLAARKSSRRALSEAALEILRRRDPGSLDAPEDLVPAGVCIQDDDLDAAGESSEELEQMLVRADRDHIRTWLESLPTDVRTIFVLRAVAGFTATETASLLAAHGGAGAEGWTPDAVRSIFRQGLCSLASQLLHESVAK